jgi:alpha-tubulin suppressor-like RCC1 family protein
MKKNYLLVVTILLATTALLAPPTISSAQLIAGGYAHSLAVCSDSTVRAWGSNSWGQLGNGTTNSGSNVPVQVSSLTGITDIAGGGGHSLALKNDGGVWAWGRNSYGQLGNGTNTDSNVPVQVSGLTGITAIAGAEPGYHSLALKNDGTVWDWGLNDNGQLGNGTNTNSNVPVQVNSLTGITAIAAGGDWIFTGGWSHSLALKNDGTIWAWGDNYFGQLGNGTNTDSNVPVQVSSLTGISAIAGGGLFSLALKNDGTVWAWGGGGVGELGNGTYTSSNVPVQVSFLTGIAAIDAGYIHSFALKNDGTVWAWAWNVYGQFGDGTTISTNAPVQVNSLTGITAIAAVGYAHSLALKNDGTVWACGYNSSGQLGNGTTGGSSNVPMQVTGLCQIATAANEITDPLSISVYPNPANELLVISYPLLGDKKATITINDIAGQLIYKTTTTADRVEVSTKDFVQGVYVVQIEGADFVETKKFIVSK